MRSHTATCAACCIAAAIALLASAETASAQRRPENPDLKREQRNREIREANLRNAETKAALESIDQKRVAAAIEQVKEDFKQIQIVRNEMVRNLLANKPLDYHLIAHETGDIHKRSDRLRSYLMPPVTDENKDRTKSQIEFNGDEMKDALVRLCNLIAGFIDNPVLKTPDKVDVEQSAKAGSDLLTIIELSGNIKRSADRLSKQSK
ncbi:MAG TPA: hypothetical protein VKA70_09680 [Blastocatellia bacterium]|nr:hypothetical protein [Blastocatellia bacterium]